MNATLAHAAMVALMSKYSKVLEIALKTPTPFALYGASTTALPLMVTAPTNMALRLTVAAAAKALDVGDR